MTYSDETKMYRCSARGVDGISLYEVISENSDLLDGFGGHTLAAGLYFSAEKSSFNDVKTALNKTIKEVLNGKELKPFINIDLEVYPNDISVELVEEISQLEPFGASNPSPVFAMKNLKIKQKRLMGENKDHLRLTVQSGNYEFNCIRWQQGDIALVEGDMMDVAFHPQINEFNGNISVQLIVDDIHSEHLKGEEKEENIGVKLFDHRKKTNILPLVNDYVKNSKQNIMIFAESKAVKDSLAPFKFLSDKIFNRINLTSCDSLMFFDYPADKETFDRILEETSPASIHFMNYEIKNLCDKDFLTTFIKMLRFACNNNNGKVDLLRCCSALGLSYETILTLLDLFEEINFIKVFEKNEEFYFLELSEISDLSVVLNHKKYLEVKFLIEDCRNFQKNLLECDLTSLELV